MGVEPFLISSTLAAVLGQRLLRGICPTCRTPYQPRETLLAELGLSLREIAGRNFYCGKGCDACNHTGYKGRKGIFELLKITEPLRELINERAPTVMLKEKAIELGMVTLRQDGLRGVFAGETTIEEVLKYT
jgi:type IV pilus assembly protein PilB